MYFWKGTKDQLSLVLGSLGKVAGSFEGADRHGIGTSFRIVIGFTLLANFYDAFVTKSDGGTDEMGIKWEELRPSTIAGRRVGKKDLEDPLIKDRVRAVEKYKRKLLPEYRLTLTESQAQAAATRRANQLATKETGRTKIETLGYRQVKILQDYGFLLGSLTPGQISNTHGIAAYTKPSIEGGEDQIFEVGIGEITFGSDTMYAGFHQYGTKKMPARPFFPPKGVEIPQLWIDDMMDAATRFWSDAIDYYLTMESQSI